MEDLLFTMPFRYEDRSNLKPVSALEVGETATIVGEIVSANTFGHRWKKTKMFEATVQGERGGTLALKWWRGEYLAGIFERGKRVAVYGKVEFDEYSNALTIFHPEYEILDESAEEAEIHVGRLVPVYEGTGRITTRAIRTWVHRILQTVELPQDRVPESVRKNLGLMPLAEALRDAHFPAADAALLDVNEYRTPAQFRLIFDELFFLECGLALKRRRAKEMAGISFELGENVREKLKEILPFKPTGAQKRVLGEIAKDMASPQPMNRLLQGDVGSGKTLVAMEAAVIAIENGYQAAIMAPTEILASQHFYSFRRTLEKAGYVVAHLTGSATAREKKQIKKLLATGYAHVAVGTHALVSEDVEFAKLGLVIIDEQHRFGVMQRLQLQRKGVMPDVLVMTATPIPRTLALTFYGDLDVSVLDEMPPGRTPITTRHATRDKAGKVYEFVRDQVTKGRQAYVVCPVVEESTARDVKAAVELYAELSQGPLADLEVGLLHGRLKSDDKDAVMSAFAAGEIDVLVATTVVEVGVDVPNATVMVIEHAEQFGLAQLHQLRGRVGRGEHKSYCVLLTGELNDTAKVRIETMVETQDGFRIADTDLQLRGPGEFFGTKQSGMPSFRVANILRDRKALEAARSEAQSFVNGESDPDEMRTLVDYIRNHWQRKFGLVLVG